MADDYDSPSHFDGSVLCEVCHENTTSNDGCCSDSCRKKALRQLYIDRADLNKQIQAIESNLTT